MSTIIPYKEQPVVKKEPVGNTESGILELPKYYDLTPPEYEYIKELNEQYGIKSQFEDATKIAQEIIDKQSGTYTQIEIDQLIQKILSLEFVSDKEIVISELIELVKSIKGKKREESMSEVVGKILSRDTETIMNNIALITEWKERQDEQEPIHDRILATAMLKFRVFAGDDVEEDQKRDWELKDTIQALEDKKINYSMIKALAVFADNERNHWQNPLNTEIDDEELKKRLSE